MNLMSRILLSTLLTLGVISTADASPTLPTVPDRILFISGAISSPSLSPIYSRMDKLLAIPTNKEKIVFILDSPGGEVIGGMRLVNQIRQAKSLGIDVDCYVTNMAASMAFQILTQCSNRYALNSSYLLWHGVRAGVSEPITTAVAHALYEDLRRMDETVYSQLFESLNIRHVDVQRHFMAETLWTGAQLAEADPNFLTARDSFKEVVHMLAADGIAKSGSSIGSLFGGSTNFLYSIWRKYEYLLFEE